MKKILKYALWSLLGVVVTVSTVLAYVALTFDPNDYKPQIIQAVQDSTQRTLKLDGDIKLMFFPSIGAHLGKVSLSEFQSEQVFASVSDASVSLAVWPLLQKQLVVNQVVVNGVRINVTRYKEGKTNLDDFLTPGTQVQADTAAQPQSSPVAFDIASLDIEDCELHFDDQVAGNKLAVTELSLKTGRLTNALPTPVAFSAQIKMTQPRAEVSVRMATTLNFDLERNRYSLKGLELNAEGDVMDVTGLVVKMAGDASVDLPAENYALKQLVLNASGKRARESFQARLVMPGISLKQEQFSGENLHFNAEMDGALGRATTSLALPSFKGDMDKFSLQGLSLQADLTQPEQSLSARIDTVLIGSLKTMQFNLKDMDIALKANGDKLPGKVVESHLKGSVQADIERQNIHAKFSGGILQSQIKAEAAIKNFKLPVIRYDIEIDKLDLDPYLPAKTAKDAPQKSAVPEQPFDLTALKALDVNGSLRIGALKAANVKLTRLRVDLKAKDGVAIVEPLSAALYRGAINGKLRVDAHASSFAITQQLSGVEIAPLMKDAADLELAEGKGNISVAVTSQGNTVGALKKALNGLASVELEDGAIRGINLGKLVQGVQNLSKDSKAETLGVDKGEKTPFTEFKASLKIKDGIAHNDDLSVRSTVLRLSGSGDVDIGRDKMDYQAKVILAKTDQGRTGTLPVRVYGPFDALQIKVDYAELLADIARQRLNEEKAALKQKLDAQRAAAQAKLEAERDAAKAKIDAERAAAKVKLDAEKAAAKAQAEEKLKQGLKGLLK